MLVMSVVYKINVIYTVFHQIPS